MSLLEDVNTTTAKLEQFLGASACPEVAIILGSGLGAFVESLSDCRSLSYAEIPGFPQSTVKGHAGQLVYGHCNGLPVLVMQGRFHFYEGYPTTEIVRPVRALIQLGVKTMVVTNAAGGVNKDLAPGDLMLIKDHMNFSGRNPLVGSHHPEFGERFPDMSVAYDIAYQKLAHEVAASEKIELKEGVYSVLGGPSYETPAEVRALSLLGADAVGMSTVFEVIAARQMGAKILACSLITNHAAGIVDSPLSHQEVVEVGREASGRFVRWLTGVVSALKSS